MKLHQVLAPVKIGVFHLSLSLTHTLVGLRYLRIIVLDVKSFISDISYGKS